MNEIPKSITTRYEVNLKVYKNGLKYYTAHFT